MKFISLGLQCSVPDGIKLANMYSKTYPFDWLWSPSKTTYAILSILLKDGVEKAVEYMTTGYTYFKYMGNEHYISVDHTTESQMNKISGLGITHYTIDEEYKCTLKRRLERLRVDIKTEPIVFIYADAANSYLNYHLDDVVYGIDATEYLLKIHDLIYPLNKNIKIVYFCWKEREKENGTIEYISYDFQGHWSGVSNIIKNYFVKNYENKKSIETCTSHVERSNYCMG